jgi:hypothetical protein
MQSCDYCAGRQIDFLEKQLIVGEKQDGQWRRARDPTERNGIRGTAGLAPRVPDAVPAHYVFPTERDGLADEKGYLEGRVVPYATDPTKPIGSWKVVWTAATHIEQRDLGNPSVPTS